MRCKQVLSVALVLGLALIVPTAYTEGNKTGLPETQITIDGRGEDWVGRSVLCVDPAGDAEAGFLDLTTGYAFVNQDALYLLIDTVDPRASFVQFDMFIKADTKTLLLSWQPGQPTGNLADITIGFEYIGPAIHSSFAFGPALEVRVDLRDLGSPERVNLNRITVMVGECCQQPAWHVADEWRPTRSTPVVDEIDAALAQRAQRTERPGHVIMAAGGVKADYLYRGFVQVPCKIAWGPDGHLYIADYLGRHVVRLSPNGTMSDLGTWRNPNMWNDDGPRGIAFDSKGNLYVNNHAGGLYAIGPDGNVEALPGIRGQPVGGITFSSDDELYYTDMGGGRVLKVGTDGQSQVIALGIENAHDLAFGLDGELYVSQYGQNRVVKVDVKSGVVSEFFSDPLLYTAEIYLVVDSEGDLWVRGTNSLFQLSPTGTPKSFRVNGKRYSGDAFELDIQTPGGITFDEEGRLWIASYNSSIRYLEPLMPGEDILGMTMTVIAPGFAPGFNAADLEITRDGTLYVYNNNPSPGELWRISSEGEVEVLLHLHERGNIGMALDDQGRLYLGLPNGEISWLDANGSLRHYAWLRSSSMTFAADGYLYAAVGSGRRPRSIVRIVGKDNYSTLISQIGGKVLGPDSVHIDPALGEGLYIYDESRNRVYYVDFDGQASAVADIPGTREPTAMAVSPKGDIFVISHGPHPYGYALHWIQPDGHKEIYARGIYGDPLGAVVSPDGHWLYISENGAIDKIPIIGSD
ncbi:MAG TPA: NHL repeat-containing protein [Acidobacteriota bacterium]|nr:NHL repeat-containing protein [Acidobacteriota bacterium]